ncbi:LCP family protein [Ornithinimicrobium sufpigmenti]|uniref:LCP family protein n=1 Tax=Ornithinimicrobium sufpigmenti TaxID=2508882 RepID=UPI001035A6BF|nr:MULTISPECIES: LCP family protein [unclassified Ornithinimicrobium]
MSADDDRAEADDGRHGDGGPGDGGPGDGQPARTGQHRDRDGMGRALGLTTLSAILPGAGLLRTRRWKLGLGIVAAAVGLLAGIGVYAGVNGLTTTAFQTAADTGRLRLILGVAVAGTVLWIGVIALTAVLTRPRRPSTGQKVSLAAFTALLCVAVSAPAAIGVRYISAHVDAVDRVFNSGSMGGGGPDAPQPTSLVGNDPENPWADLPRVNVLLLGSDATEAREGTRTDTMMVASIDTTTGDSVLFSIPRNLQNVPIPRDLPLHELYPDGYNCGPECLMNGIWTAAEAHAEEQPDLYVGDPHPGLTATQRVLAQVLGLPIHQTVIVNLQGFEDLIDAMGGVVVNVQERIPINGRTYTDAQGRLQLDPNSPRLEWLEPGPQRLDGDQALGYSRSRVTSDDFSRMRRQRCMVAAVVDQANPMTMLQRYPQIIGAVGDNMVTDIPVSDLDEWAELMLKVQGAQMQSLPLTSSNIDTAAPNYSQIRMWVWDALYAVDPPEPAADADDAGEETGTADDAVSAAPTPEDTPDTDEAEMTTTPADQLSDIGAVCS